MMNITTFEDDLLELRPFAERLEAFIEVEHQFVEGSLVVALSSKFGSGKTTFLRMWENDLQRGAEDANVPLVISLNAWESDYYGDSLFALISALVDRLQERGESAESIVNAAKDIGWFATALGGQMVKAMTGLDPVAAGNFAENKRSKRDGPLQVPQDVFSAYQGRKEAMANLKGVLQEFVASSEPRVVFLVDELDKCRPDYAVSYLETIKHVFDMEGAVFILAADRQHLENSAKTAFGDSLDFEEYYRKFVHREIALPPVSDSGYKKLATTYVDHYLQRDGLRNCYMALDRDRVGNISGLVGALSLTPRQIQEVFRILGHLFAASEEHKGRLLWCIAVGSIAMAAFRVGNPNVYHRLGTQQFEPREAYDYLTNLLADRSVKWWFELFLTGGGLKLSEGQSAAEIMTELGFIREGRESVWTSDLFKWEEGWGHRVSCGFAQIHEKIDHILQWEE
jgi:hypothetical protein